MEYFWRSENKDILARDVLQYFHTQGKSWNQQNVANYLKNLQKIGMLRTEVRNNKYYYYPTMTEEEFRLLPVRKVLEEDFHGSYSSLVAALLGPVDAEEVKMLKKMLEEYENSL